MIQNSTTLSIDEAFRAGCIENLGFLPPVIRIPKNCNIALVLSETEDFYYKVTKECCGCDQFIAGIRPCIHQSRAFCLLFRDIRRQTVAQNRLNYEEENKTLGPELKSFVENWKNQRKTNRLRKLKKLLKDVIRSHGIKHVIKYQHSYKKDNIYYDSCDYDPFKEEKDYNYRRDLFG